jgi:ribosomal protein L16 Arg81 hydroxylase
MSTDNFVKLIQPITSDLFFDEYWDRKPLFVSRSEQNYYSNLFSRENIADIIYFSKIKQSDIELHKNGQKISYNFSTENIQIDDMNEIYQQYYNGSTLILRELHRCWKPTLDLCRSIESILNHRAQVNMYLTPKNSQGFPPHFDTHGVFILQVQGFKIWKIYDTFDAFTLPIREQGISSDQLDKPLYEIVLKAGDLLYIPSGYVHEAFTSESSSLHLTLGILAYRWLDLLFAALSSASEQNVSLRKSLPVGFLHDKNKINCFKSQFEELFSQLSNSIKFEEAIEKITEFFVTEKLQLSKQSFSQIDDINSISLDSLVKRKEGTVCHVFEDGDLAIIQFPGNKVSGPKSIKSAYQFIASSEKFAVSSLPNSLTNNSKLVLARRLIREGLLEYAS